LYAGGFNGNISSLPSHQLGATVIKEALARCQVEPNDVSEVLLGQVLNAGEGQNPARQAAMAAGIPDTVPAMGINMVCGSGLRTVAMAAQAIKAGDCEIVVAGGQESMSRAVHFVHMRNGVKFGNVELKDTMLVDGLTDAFHNCHMGITAENVAKEFDVSRTDQDAFAYKSQMKTKEAVAQKLFDEEIVAVEVKSRKGVVVVAQDEHPRPETTLESLGKLKPAFVKDAWAAGSVTAGNASGLNDGAAAVVVMSSDEAIRRGLKPLAKISSFAVAGVRPDIMGMGPVPAVQKAVCI
jgi:acetyl-CoA C-acetyltransferase